jgi:hypothetical protein
VAKINPNIIKLNLDQYEGKAMSYPRQWKTFKVSEDSFKNGRNEQKNSGAAKLEMRREFLGFSSLNSHFFLTNVFFLLFSFIILSKF